MNWDFICRGEIQDLDEAARRSAGGSFIRLSQGYTHYELKAIPDALAVVLVHGFSTPYFIWDPTFGALARAGLSPIRYDLFGRGYSDRPHVHYNLDLFVRQLRELLDALGLGKVALVGLSTGGLIASAFTVEQPARVLRLALIDPVGAREVPMKPLYRIATLPVIGDLGAILLSTEQVASGAAKDFFDGEQTEGLREQFLVQTKFRGFKRAALSSVRHRMLGAYPAIYERLGKTGVPVMLAWGEEDPAVPFDQSQILLRLIPGALFHAFPGCGHAPHYEKPEDFNTKLLDFLMSHDPKST